MIKLGLNGFGRIGRNVLRALYESGYRDSIQVTAINDLADAATNTHLLEFDSVHGRFRPDMALQGNRLLINGDYISLYQEPEPQKIPWESAGVDFVLECTGRFNTRDKAQNHLGAGVKKVLVSAPCKHADATVVYGVNDHILTPDHRVVSNASCTTNCLAPVVKVLHENFTILNGVMTTVHSYTNDQNLLDLAHSKDLFRARAAALSLIPTKTGAATAIGLVLPELDGKLTGMAIRVPTPNVSLLDLTLQVEKLADEAEVNATMREASESMPVLGYNERALVSTDFNHHNASAIFDANHTRVQGQLIKVCVWYDNEWGFSNRMLDTALKMASV